MYYSCLLQFQNCIIDLAKVLQAILLFLKNYCFFLLDLVLLSMLMYGTHLVFLLILGISNDEIVL